MEQPDIGVESLSLPQQRYVEVIGELVRLRGSARMTDIAERLAVSVPSASESVRRLVEQGVATRDARLGVDLSPAGRQMANQLDSRHASLKHFMVDVMAMSPQRADEVACRVEHCVDRDFAERLLDLSEFLRHEYPWTLSGIAAHVRSRHAAATAALDAAGGI